MGGLLAIQLVAALLLGFGAPADVLYGRAPRLVNVVTSGYGHRCLVSDQGEAYCWGWNAYGQLGDGTTTDRANPVRVKGLGERVKTISAGTGSTCAALASGAVKCWGQNTYGQLGNGTTRDSTLPVQVSGLTRGWIGTGLGDDFACARSMSGDAVCWGDNHHGQLGSGTIGDGSTTPRAVTGLAGTVRRIAVGSFHACALSFGDGMKCWGNNQTGSLGIGRAGSTVRPHSVRGMKSGVRGISADGQSATTCAALRTGDARCWGHNSAGQVGTGERGANVERPALVRGLDSEVRGIAVGDGTTCAIKRGALWCWGDGDRGSRASGDQSDSALPRPARILTSGVTQVSMGGTGGCALRKGRAYCWGMTISPAKPALEPVPVLF